MQRFVEFMFSVGIGTAGVIFASLVVFGVFTGDVYTLVVAAIFTNVCGHMVCQRHPIRIEVSVWERYEQANRVYPRLLTTPEN